MGHFIHPKRDFSLIAFASILGITLILWFAFKLHFYLGWLIAASLVTFLFYFYDKTQSQKDGNRIPEIVLHLLSLIGGFIGGWIGCYALRHKTQPKSFLIVLMIATILHVGVIVVILWLL